MYGAPDENVKDGRFLLLHRVAIILVHKPYYQSVSERFHRPLEHSRKVCFRVLSFLLLFATYINALLTEFEKDTFVSAYADDLLIARTARSEDMIMASLQPEVDKVVAWSDRARLTLDTSKCETAWTVQTWPVNPTTPLMENECSAIQSRVSWVSDATDSSRLQSMCESSTNRCPAVSTFPMLWVARPGGGTLRTIVRSTS